MIVELLRRFRPASAPVAAEDGTTPEVFDDVAPVDGWHSFERDEVGAFCWSRQRFTLRFPPGPQYWALRLCYPVDGERLVARDGLGSPVVVALHAGWHTYAIDLSPLRRDTIDFEVSRSVPVPGDPRELGVRIRRLTRLRHADDCASQAHILANHLANQREFEAGAIELESLPSLIRVAVETRCNIKPRCVYCDWERAKADEAESPFRFTLASLEEFGKFYATAGAISELGYGEPPMSPEFSALTETLHVSGRSFEFACNGQVLGPAVRQALLGKDIQLMASIDGATAQTYARLRNDEFDLVLENVTALCVEKKAHRNLPIVIASYIAMRSNLEEFDGFLELMQRVGVDAIRVMGLDGYAHLLPRIERRAGAVYDYEQERLSFEECQDFIVGARAKAQRRGMPLVAVTDFGLEDGAPGQPLCREPWQTMNILNRGIVACCNNKVDRLATWSEQGDRSTEQFLTDVWNGPAYRELRSSLAQGALPAICRRSGSCAIVARHLRSEQTSL